VAFAPEIAWRAISAFAGAEEQRTDEEGRIELSIPFAERDLLASLLLEYGPDAIVREPPELRDSVVERLEAVAGA
jgi:predicted DNA-binding transcriptional regulator YafY